MSVTRTRRIYQTVRLQNQKDQGKRGHYWKPGKSDAGLAK